MKETEDTNNKRLIHVHELTRRFGSFTAVDRISFEVEAGEIFGFLGANGAGKTTAMRMLTGLLEPTEGNAWIAGNDIANEPEKIKQNIGYMSQKFSLYEDLTVYENIRFYGGVYGLTNKQIKDRSKHLIELHDLKSVQDTPIASLPLGWRQKLAFSIALLHKPAIIFLDEPTSGVDPITRRQFWEQIYEVSGRGTTVFVTTHYMDEAEYCDTVSIMVDGAIRAMDSPKQLKQQFSAENMNDVFLKLVGSDADSDNSNEMAGEEQ